MPPEPSPAELAVLTIFVTSVCNARCETCFFWDSLNHPRDEMTLDEWAKVAETVPPVRGLQLSGGEPTLDADLVDKAMLFIHRPETSISLPTNGIRTDQVVTQVGALTSCFPQNRVIVGVSIDGPAEMHDQIRGVKDNFAKAMRTLDQLRDLQRERPNLRLTTLTCLMEKNAAAMPDLLRGFADSGRVDFVTVEPLREQTPVDGLRAPSHETLKSIQDLALELNIRLLAERYPEEMPSIVSHLDELYGIQQRMRIRGVLDLDCQAGAATGVLEANGTVRLCELLEPVGNVRDFDHDWNAVWHSEPARRQREHILTRACSCTHCVNVGQSIAFDAEAEARRRETERQLAARAAAKS
ncbi:radical SAM protein [Candidatus Sumerlaeota bacterium]|nr:radical SAM protein [Candidatus Sumerlaeota bacterium]